jgi:hypothetical protein
MVTRVLRPFYLLSYDPSPGCSTAHSRIFPAYPHFNPVFQFLLECPYLVFMTLAYKITSKTNAMKTFVKNYIGKGKKVEGLEIIRISFKIADLVKFSHKFKDEDFITMEIAKLKSTDAFGHDYTAYVNRLEEQETATPTQDEKPAKKSVKRTRKAEAVASQDEVPF